MSKPMTAARFYILEEWLTRTWSEPTVEQVREVAMELLAELKNTRAEVQRLKWRLNHQTDDDVAACRRGQHGGDCGASTDSPA